jgi:uncharacterized membrane protein (Fun14 family)
MVVPVIDQQLISSAIFPLAGGGLPGVSAGWAIKKIMKLAFIILGLFALALGYLEYQKWISVNWVIVENQTSTIMSHAANKIALVTQNMSHKIPIGLGVIGFLPGLAEVI